MSANACWTAALTALTACTSVAVDARTLDGTRWQVTSINGHATPRSDRFYMAFGRATFRTEMGCNVASGDYRIQGDMIVPGVIGSTELACDAADDRAISPMRYESWGFAVLRQRMRMDWRSDRHFTLRNAAGLIELERTP